MRKLAAVGLVAVLVVVLGGCGFFTKTGLETGDQDQALQPQSVGRGGGETIDDKFAEIARRVPAFGGMFFDFVDGVKNSRRVLSRDNSVLYIYLLDTRLQVQAAAEDDVRLVGVHRGRFPQDVNKRVFSPMSGIQNTRDLGTLTVCASGFSC